MLLDKRDFFSKPLDLAVFDNKRINKKKDKKIPFAKLHIVLPEIRLFIEML